MKSVMVGLLAAGSVVAACHLGGCIIVAVDRDDAHSFHGSHARRIGVELTDVADSTATQAGVDASRCSIVTHVSSGSAADKAGLRKWDIITHVDGKDWARTDAVREAVRSKRDGETVALRIVREGKPVELTVTPDQH